MFLKEYKWPAFRLLLFIYVNREPGHELSWITENSLSGRRQRMEHYLQTRSIHSRPTTSSDCKSRFLTTDSKWVLGSLISVCTPDGLSGVIVSDLLRILRHSWQGTVDWGCIYTGSTTAVDHVGSGDCMMSLPNMYCLTVAVLNRIELFTFDELVKGR